LGNQNVRRARALEESLVESVYFVCPRELLPGRPMLQMTLLGFNVGEDIADIVFQVAGIAERRQLARLNILQ